LSRIDNISKFAQKKEEQKLAKERAIQQQFEECVSKIKSFKPRIDELLTVGNACLEHGIALEGEAWGGHQGYDTHQFITNGWSHLLGFVCGRDQRTREVLPFTQLGIMGGGACHFDLRTDGVTVDVSGSDALYVLKRFVDEFDKFETEFYKYVDKITA
jgi:hypothetical protein